jgi:3-methylcrotonyl-CoA carboxylase alpha subunit
MNTRLQVEHPVTEMVTGLDLVEWQLRVAAGEPLPLVQDAVHRNGHAIEVRLYAEDPAHDFLPGSGRLESLRLPAPDKHVRIDSGVIEGDTVSIFYDPMIAKLIVWDQDRPHALTRLRDALATCEIRGPKSNIEFLERLIRHPVVVDGTIDTSYLDRHLDEVLVVVSPTREQLAAAATAALLCDAAKERATALVGRDPHSPWALADGWRVGHDGLRTLVFVHAGERTQLLGGGTDGAYRVRISDAELAVDGARLNADGTLSARIEGRMHRWHADVDAARVTLHDADGRIVFERVPAFHFVADDSVGTGNRITAPMPGRIVLVKVAAGDTVTQDQELLVMEAMKMELSLKSPRAGTIATLSATAGDFVDGDAVLVTLEAT